MSMIGSLAVSIIGDDTSFQKALKEFDKHAAALEKKLTKLGKNIAKVGDAISADVSEPLRSAGEAAVRFGADINAVLEKVAKAVPGSAGRIADLQENIRDLTGQTRQTTDDLAGGLDQVVAAGDSAVGAAERLATGIGEVRTGVTETVEAVKRMLESYAAFKTAMATGSQGVADGIYELVKDVPILGKAAAAIKDGLGKLTGEDQEKTQILEDGNEEREALARDWAKRLADEEIREKLESAGTEAERQQIRLDLLEQTKAEAVAIAKKQGRETMAIEDFYQGLRTDIVKDQSSQRMEILRQNLDDQFLAIMEGTGSAAEIFQAFEGVVKGVYDDLAKNVAGSLAQNITDQTQWLEQTLVTIAAAVAAYIQSAYMALVTFFAWLGPFAPLAAAGVIGAALVTMKELAQQASEMIGLAKGGVVTGATTALIGEGADDEAVLPLNRSVFSQLAEGIVGQMTRFAVPMGQLAMAGAGGDTINHSTTSHSAVHLNVGVLVADEMGIKQLERRLSRFRMAETKRKGEG